jgi:hypothetical protein
MPAYTYRLPRKYRCRPRGKNSYAGPVVGAVIFAALASAGTKAAVHHGHAGHTRAAVTAVIIPAGSNLGTPAGVASALLAADSLPRTSCNLNAVTAWERAEGGGFGNQASYDPLNVNPGPGAGWPGHPAIGAWAFPDAATGLRYTVSTLNNGYYGGILSALRAGNSAQAVCNAIMASPWAANRYGGTLTATC